MNIDIDATYRDGALHPETPLNLPENTPVRVRVVAQPDTSLPVPFTKTQEIRYPPITSIYGRRAS